MQVKMLECFKRSSVMSLPVYALYLQTLLFNFTNTKLNHKRNSLRERGKRGRREREGETERGREMERKDIIIIFLSEEIFYLIPYISQDTTLGRRDSSAVVRPSAC